MLTAEQFESEEILTAVATSDDQDGDNIETSENEADESDMSEEIDEELEDEMEEEADEEGADEVDDVEEEA